MFASLFKLFGCSPKKNQENKNVSKDTLDKQISKSIEDFKNRPIHKTLTEQIIDAASDDELLQVVFDNLSEKQPADYTKEYKTVTAWNKERQAIYVIWLLEAEVNNGGYNQYYFNSSGQFYKLLPDALKLVGANKFATLTEKANSTYEKENDKITKHQDRTLEGFSKSYEDNPLNKFDDEFYVLYKAENLQKLQVEFIRKHKQEFIDK
ncbi:MAG: DUF4375 domain-containing protein [Bacteroidota bacterium]